MSVGGIGALHSRAYLAAGLIGVERAPSVWVFMHEDLTKTGFHKHHVQTPCPKQKTVRGHFTWLQLIGVHFQSPAESSIGNRRVQLKLAIDRICLHQERCFYIYEQMEQ